MSDPYWLTLEEVCDRTKLSESTIDRWIKDTYLVPGIHYGGKGRLRRFDPQMIDLAIRFQDDPKAHEQAIAAKRRELFGRKRA
jgi:predicted DNA-binding transcriptional regulator AlpA